jgi:hypothetical protein
MAGLHGGGKLIKPHGWTGWLNEVSRGENNLAFHAGCGNFPIMTTVAKADKSRLTIRGLVDGHQYIVREQPGGWFITPESR